MGHPSSGAIVRLLIAVGAVTATLTACSTDGRTLDKPTFPLPAPPLPATTVAPETTAPPQLLMIAPWQDGASIPTRYTCDDDDVAPALTWTNVPVGTVELAVTVTDLDAADFAHWILYGLEPDETGLVEGVVPNGAFQWSNSFGVKGWNGPCPPAGQTHRYQFTIHALNQQLELADDAPASDVISVLNLTSIAKRSVSGTYVRTE